MANVTEKAPSVELSDALKAGFHDAMERISSLNLDPANTLVDQISEEKWSTWDASKEFAVVADSDGLNGDGLDEDGVDSLAA